MFFYSDLKKVGMPLTFTIKKESILSIISLSSVGTWLKIERLTVCRSLFMSARPSPKGTPEKNSEQTRFRPLRPTTELYDESQGPFSAKILVKCEVHF